MPLAFEISNIQGTLCIRDYKAAAAARFLLAVAKLSGGRCSLGKAENPFYMLRIDFRSGADAVNAMLAMVNLNRACNKPDPHQRSAFIRLHLPESWNCPRNVCTSPLRSDTLRMLASPRMADIASSFQVPTPHMITSPHAWLNIDNPKSVLKNVLGLDDGDRLDAETLTTYFHASDLDDEGYTWYPISRRNVTPDLIGNYWGPDTTFGVFAQLGRPEIGETIRESGLLHALTIALPEWKFQDTVGILEGLGRLLSDLIQERPVGERKALREEANRTLLFVFRVAMQMPGTDPALRSMMCLFDTTSRKVRELQDVRTFWQFADRMNIAIPNDFACATQSNLVLICLLASMTWALPHDKKVKPNIKIVGNTGSGKSNLRQNVVDMIISFLNSVLSASSSSKAETVGEKYGPGFRDEAQSHLEATDSMTTESTKQQLTMLKEVMSEGRYVSNKLGQKDRYSLYELMNYATVELTVRMRLSNNMVDKLSGGMATDTASRDLTLFSVRCLKKEANERLTRAKGATTNFGRKAAVRGATEFLMAGAGCFGFLQRMGILPAFEKSTAASMFGLAETISRRRAWTPGTHTQEMCDFLAEVPCIIDAVLACYHEGGNMLDNLAVKGAHCQLGVPETVLGLSIVHLSSAEDKLLLLHEAFKSLHSFRAMGVTAFDPSYIVLSTTRGALPGKEDMLKIVDRIDNYVIKPLHMLAKIKEGMSISTDPSLVYIPPGDVMDERGEDRQIWINGRATGKHACDFHDADFMVPRGGALARLLDNRAEDFSLSEPMTPAMLQALYDDWGNPALVGNVRKRSQKLVRMDEKQICLHGPSFLGLDLHRELREMLAVCVPSEYPHSEFTIIAQREMAETGAAVETVSIAGDAEILLPGSLGQRDRELGLSSAWENPSPVAMHDRPHTVMSRRGHLRHAYHTVMKSLDVTTVEEAGRAITESAGEIQAGIVDGHDGTAVGDELDETSAAQFMGESALDYFRTVQAENQEDMEDEGGKG